MKKIMTLLAALIITWALHSQTYREMMNDPGAYNFYEIQAAAEAHFAAVGTGQGTGYNQYMRWEMYNEPRAFPTGIMENWAERTIDSYREYVESPYFQNLPAEKAHNGYWEELGPTNWTNQNGNSAGNGRINVVAFHPSNSNIIWAGSALGGLWRSNDAGLNWTPLTDGMPNLGVSGIAVHPTNTNIIYILTGDGDGTYAPTTGVLKTTDGGVTWKKTALDFSTTSNSMGTQTNLPRYTNRGYKLIINPDSPNTLFAATTSGVRRTTDGGNTWTTVRNGDFRDVAFRPGVSNTIYAVSTTQLHRSTDGGTTWTTITNGLPASNFDRIAIGVSPANNQWVYLVYGGGTLGFRGLYRSTNSGTSFTERSTSPNIFTGAQDGSGTASQAWYDIAIAVSQTDANTLLVGGINTWRSTNGGTSWAVMSNWRADQASASKYVHADIHFLGYRGSVLWAGTDGGVFRTANNGDTWANRSNGLGIMQFYKICTATNTWYGGTQDCGTNRLNSGNTTATHILGADGFDCIATSTTMFASTQNALVKRGISSTGNWTTITPSGVTSPWNIQFILRPGTTTTLFYGGTNGTISRSTNSGDSWTNIGGGLSGRIHSLAMGASNTSRLYFANSATVRRTDNATAGAADITFTNINAGLPGSARTGIAVDPNNSNIVFVCFSGYSAGNKVFQSNNAGSSWINISGTLPNVPVHCIVHEGSNGGIYIGTDIGVFYRNNSIGGWVPFMNGLPTTMVTELEIRSGEGRIYAGTFGRGMWRSDVFSNCSAALSLTPLNDPSNANYTGYQFYSSSNTITSNRIITGGVGTDVTYRAAGSVNLNEGFEVKPENEFFAQIGNCNSVFQPLLPFHQGILEVYSTKHDTHEEAVSGEQVLPLSFDAHLRKPTRAFPNPFGVSFTLEVAAIEQDREVWGELYDLSGKLVRTIDRQSVPQGMRMTTEVYADDLTSGVYMLRVYENENVEIFKLVKQ